MRAARGLLAALLALAALALAAAWVVPPLLDWNGYRDSIAAVASRMLGQRVTIAGAVRLALLPRAALSAERVSLGDGALAVGALRLEAALAPLLAGRIEPHTIVLQAPLLLLPWPLPGFAAAPPALPPGLSVRIEDGTVRIGSIAATGLQARATVGETGALAVDGQAMIGGQSGSFTLRLTAFGPDGAAGLDARLQGDGRLAGVIAAFRGQVGGQTGQLRTLDGTVTLAGGDLSALLPAPAIGFRAEGRLTVADGLVAADDLAVELGGAPARAAAALRLLPQPRLDVSLAVGRLDLAAWLRPLLHPAAADAWGLPVGLDLSAEAAELAGATLRRLRCTFDLSEGAAELREAAAILPGEATLGLSGRINRGAAVTFAGTGRIEAPDLPATAGWAARALGLNAGLLAGLPRSATLAGRVGASAERVALEGLSGRLEGGDASGALTLQPGRPPAVAVVARLARLDLDPWLPGGWPGRPALTALGAAGGLRLDVQATQAALRGMALHEVVIEAEAESGGLAVRRLAAGLAGARLEASGTIRPDGALAGARAELIAGTAADLAPAVAAAIGSDRLGPLLQGAGALHLTLSGQGAPDAVAGHAALEAAGGSLVAEPVLDATRGVVSGSLRLTHPSATGLLARLGVPPAAAAWLGAGELALQADVTASAEQVATPRLTLQAGALQAQAALTADWVGPLPRLTGRIAATTLPLPWPAGSGTEPLPFGLLNGWEAALEVGADRLLLGPLPVATEARARIGVAEGVLGVGSFRARLGGGEIIASAAIDGAATPPTLEADGQLSGTASAAGKGGAAGLDLLSGTVAARLRAAAAGYSLPALRATLQGATTLDVTHGALGGFDLGRLRAAVLQASGDGATGAALQAALAPSLAGGQTAFDTLHAEAELSSGGLTLRRTRLAGPDGQATADGTVGLAGDAIDLHLGLRPAIEGGPELGLRLTGPAAAPVRTPELSGLLRWLSHS